MATASGNILNNIKLEKELHVRKADTFYDALRENTVLATSDPSVEVLCFDYQQNMPLPHVPAGDVFYKRQLWVFNFAIYAASTGKTTCYMYDEMKGKKGQNEVVSFLDHYITNKMSPTVDKLMLFSDNCSAQNKNHTIVEYLFTLVKKGRFQTIKHYFPIPGHSFLPCDRSFGLIEKQKRKKERIYVPSEWERMVSNTCRKFSVISVSQDMILNFSLSFDSVFKKSVTNASKEKFSISKYRLFEYDSSHSRFVRCSLNTNAIVHSDFAIEKSCISGTSNVVPERLYANVLPIKKAKMKDVKDLVEKYVPQVDQWYYSQMTVIDDNANQSDESGSETD